MEWFPCFKGALFPKQEKRLFVCGKQGFTLLEMMVSLALMGIFMSALTVCMYQVVEFAAIVAERTRCCQEIRTFYETFTADCERLFFSKNEEPIVFHLPSKGDGAFSLVLLKRVSGGWERSFVTQDPGNSICAVQYRFHSGMISRHLWKAETTVAALASRTPLMQALSKKDAVLSRNLIRNVSYFQLHSIDERGQKQAQWIPGSSVGLEYSVTFLPFRQHMPQTFHARIPVPRMGKWIPSP